MVYVPVQCPHCQSTEVIKAGKRVSEVLWCSSKMTAKVVMKTLWKDYLS
jgi:transposase-like protein